MYDCYVFKTVKINANKFTFNKSVPTIFKIAPTYILTCDTRASQLINHMKKKNKNCFTELHNNALTTYIGISYLTFFFIELI